MIRTAYRHVYRFILHLFVKYFLCNLLSLFKRSDQQTNVNIIVHIPLLSHFNSCSFLQLYKEEKMSNLSEYYDSTNFKKSLRHFREIQNEFHTTFSSFLVNMKEFVKLINSAPRKNAGGSLTEEYEIYFGAKLIAERKLMSKLLRCNAKICLKILLQLKKEARELLMHFHSSGNYLSHLKMYKLHQQYLKLYCKSYRLLRTYLTFSLDKNAGRLTCTKRFLKKVAVLKSESFNNNLFYIS